MGEKAAHKVLQALQRKVKQRIRELRDLELKKRNDLLAKAKASNPRQYWSLLKKAAGLSRNTRSIPDEAFVNGLVVKGDLVLKVWQEVLRKLFAADKQDPAFDKPFMQIKHEVAQEEIKGTQVDNICEELNAPIALQEVISVLHNLRNGKAGGIHSLINEILITAVMRIW